jgi:hypothetical protein
LRAGQLHRRQSRSPSSHRSSSHGRSPRKNATHQPKIPMTLTNRTFNSGH